MKNEHVLEELSAYIDGQARDSDSIARHLQQCPRCAQRYMELAKLSTHLRALRPAQVPAGFAARVVAKIRESGRRAYPYRWAGAAASLAAAAGVILFAVMAYLALGPQGQPNEPARVSGVDTGLLLAEIERRVAAGEDVELQLPVIPEDDDALLEALPAQEPAADLENQAPTGPEDLLEALAAEEWLEDFPLAVAPDADVSESLNELDEAQVARLKELLIRYALEGEQS